MRDKSSGGDGVGSKRRCCSSRRPRCGLPGRPEVRPSNCREWSGRRRPENTQVAQKPGGPREIVRGGPESRSLGSGGPHRGPQTGLHEPRESGVSCWFGATCVGVLLERMRLHLSTQRFLAERRGDRIWEASCDYAALSIERLGSRLRPGMFEQPLFPKKTRTRQRPRVSPAKGAGATRATAKQRRGRRFPCSSGRAPTGSGTDLRLLRCATPAKAVTRGGR
jgi:hypothetical protein